MEDEDEDEDEDERIKIRDEKNIYNVNKQSLHIQNQPWYFGENRFA